MDDVLAFAALARTQCDVDLHGMRNLMNAAEPGPNRVRAAVLDQTVAFGVACKVKDEHETNNDLLDLGRRVYDEGGVNNMDVVDEEDDTPAAPPIPADDTRWEPVFKRTNEAPDLYTWHRTVYYRINGSQQLLRAYHRSGLVAALRDKLFTTKIMRFQEAHLRVVEYLDTLPDPRDDLIDVTHLLACYGRGLGPSHYNADASQIRVERLVHKLKRTPLEIIRSKSQEPWTVAEVLARGPVAHEWLALGAEDDEWSPFREAERSPDTHTYYCAVVHILNRALATIRSESEDGELCDALWLYYASFTELFQHMLEAGRADDAYLLRPRGTTTGRDGQLIYGDGPCPWLLYCGNEDTRAFCAGDLPDLYHVLAAIPLLGEQHTPSFRVGKIYQKSLPFACQRRHLIRIVVTCINTEPGFWSVFSKMAWVLLANLYPGDLACKVQRGAQSMRDLLRIQELTSSKALLIRAIGGDSADVKPAAPLIVFTIIRMHVLFMTSFNAQYVRQAQRCIDWDYFKRDTLKLSEIVRSHALFADDPFGQARAQLSKTVKSPNSRVHRLRKRSMAVCLADQCNEMLEKTMFKSLQSHTQDVTKLRAMMRGTDPVASFFQSTTIGRFLAHSHGGPIEPVPPTLIGQALEMSELACRFFQHHLHVSCKSAILNALLMTRPVERMTQQAFTMMLAPSYGGVSSASIMLLCDLCTVYTCKALPKEFSSRIGRFAMHDFGVICFYLNMVALLEKISFVTLDVDTVRRTHVAMVRHRHRLYPQEQADDCMSMYDVSIALCCEKVCTLQGQGKFGDVKVAYNVETCAFVCAHGKKLKGKAGGGAEEEEEEDLKNNNDEDYDNDPDGSKAAARNMRRLEEAADAGHDQSLDFDAATFESDLIADALAMHGRGTARTVTMQDRKAVRNQRKAFSRIPCGQPVLSVSLYGRALIWGNSLDNKTRYQHCPNCASLHVFSTLNFSASETGRYRCAECARKELMHVPAHECAYCGKKNLPKQDVTPTSLEIMCPAIDPGHVEYDPLLTPEQTLQRLYFCVRHYHIARFHSGRLTKQALWQHIKTTQERKNLQHAMGIHHK